jgi:hypothetical protein
MLRTEYWRSPKKANICFGSLDLAAESGGEWWFPEINEQGKVISIMKSCGFSEDQMHRCHAEFERSRQDEHQEFLETHLFPAKLKI